jgi:cytochrome c peroxidase
MTEGFSGVLSAQTMFPVLSQDEMAGHYSENEVSRRCGRASSPARAARGT